jgi:cytochrome c551/c552
MGISGLALVAIAGLIYVAGPSYAGDSDTALKIAAALKKGDKDGASKIATTAAKKIEDVADFMHLFRPRNKGGLGWGSKPLNNPAHDGLEVMLRALVKPAPPTVTKESTEEAGYWIASLAELAIAKAPTKDMSKKTKKAWMEYSKEMREAGIALAKDAAAGGAQTTKIAAKLNTTCSNCHAIFKD